MVFHVAGCISDANKTIPKRDDNSISKYCNKQLLECAAKTKKMMWYFRLVCIIVFRPIYYLFLVDAHGEW